MRSGKLARACSGIVDRYQHTKAAHVFDGRCRFEPSCSTYLREAFTTRAFPVAFLLATWRLIRCNPLTRPGSVDPVRRTRRASRANGLKTIFAVLTLSSFVVLLIGSTASGQSIAGGCTATLNGRPPSDLTRGEPLVVKKGDTVAVRGTVPASLAGGNPKKIKSLTRVTVDIVDPFFDFSSSSANPGTGPVWGDSVNPEGYLKLGSGLYKAHGTATITSDKGSAVCLADGYIKFDGGKVVEAVAGAVGAVGLVGGALAKGAPRKTVTMSELGADLDRDFGGAPAAPPPAAADAPEEGGEDDMPYTFGSDGFEIKRTDTPFGLGFCCAVAVLAVPLVAVGMAGGGGAMPAPAGAPSRIYRKHGHTIAGALFGLLFGIGLTVVLQQEAVWVLNLWTAIVLPVALAVLSAIRAWRGIAYRVTRRA